MQSDVKQEEKKKDKNMKDEDFVDEDADVLDPSECLTFVNNPEAKALELDYFSQVGFERSQVFGGTLGAKSGGVTALAVSVNRRMVAEAVNNGQVLVYDVSKGFALVRKITTKTVQNYAALEFGRDSMSQLAGFSLASAVFKAFLMLKDKGEAPPIDTSLQGKALTQHIDQRPLIPEEAADLLPFYELTHEVFLEPEQKKQKNAAKEFAVTAGCLFGTMTHTGFQEQAIVGSKSGLVVKFNSAVQQAASKEEAKGPLGGNAQPVEYLSGHKVPVVFVQSVDNTVSPLQPTQLIVTVDVAGHIFVWRKV